MRIRLAGCNCDEGMAIVDQFNTKDVFVYATGMEPWLEFISSIRYTGDSRPIVESNLLVAKCQAQGRSAEQLFGEKTIEYDVTQEVLEVGEMVEVAL